MGERVPDCCFRSHNGACDGGLLTEDAQAAYVRDSRRSATAAAREDYDPVEPSSHARREDPHPVEYVVHGARYEGERLVELDVHCTHVGSPAAFLYDIDTITVHDVVDLIKNGEKVEGVWPGGEVRRPWPLEVVLLSDGSESVEAVNKNRPEGIDMSRLAIDE